MALSRFFGRGRETPPPPPEDVVPEEPEEEVSFDDDADPEHAPQRSWLDRAEVVFPTGVSTGSKRAAALCIAGASSRRKVQPTRPDSRLGRTGDS
jgi:hypothetical protein